MRNQAPATNERLFPCPGGAPLSTFQSVGICPVCGVRTFLTSTAGRTVVQSHKSTRLELASFKHDFRRDTARDVRRLPVPVRSVA